MYCIYGKNKVGQAVARLCDYHGFSYEMVDDADNLSSFDKYVGIIPSPWIPATHPVYKTGKVMAELDFAYQFLPRGFRIFAVTWTDGKSTTAWILYSILEKMWIGKRKTYISGNFDDPFSTTVLHILENTLTEGDIVVEISSFMSYFIGKSSLDPFLADYTVFTNLQVDHLNWHRDLQEYLDAKMNLVSHTRYCTVMNDSVFEFAREKGLILSVSPNIRKFSTDKNITPLDWTDGEEIVFSQEKRFFLSQTPLSWEHNALNLLSVAMVADEIGISLSDISTCFSDTHGLPHRLEICGEQRGVRFVDDSKSTSSQSLDAALGAFWDEKNLLLIVGGSDKWDTFDHLAKKLAQRAQAIVALWATKNHFIHIAETEGIPYLATDDLQKGITWLFAQAREWDILMLSPWCASFGLFRDYLDRAHQFREAVKNLPK